MLKLKIIVGSTRPNRFSEKLLPWLTDAVAKTRHFETEVLDLREHVLPFFDQPDSPSQIKNGQYPGEPARAWAQKIQDGDVFLVITPEYNHGYSAVLKNAFDTVYGEWNNKAIGFVGYGSVAGARSIEQLRLVAIELQMAPVRQGVHIQNFWSLPDDKGAVTEESLEPYAKPLETLLGQLAQWGGALKEMRETTAQS